MNRPDPTDTDYNEYNIKNVHRCPDGRYEIDYGANFAYRATDNVAPRVGEVVRIYWGLTRNEVRGLVVGGRVYFYKTMAEAKAEHMAWQRKRDSEARARFPEYDRRYNALPEPFRRRIDHFRRQPRFRLELEDADLYICELAVRLANACGSSEAVARFIRLPYDLQILTYPWLVTNREPREALSVVYQLAFFWLHAPDRLIEVPGALEYLSGEGYGRKKKGPGGIRIIRC